MEKKHEEDDSLNSNSIFVYVLMIMTFLVVGVGIVRGASSIDGYLALLKSRDILKSTVSQLSNENQDLKFEILKLKESPHYARKVLRDKYHVTEQGEDIVFFPE